MQPQLPLVILATPVTQTQQPASQDQALAIQDQVKVLQAFTEALHGIVQDLCRQLECNSSGHAINFGQCTFSMDSQHNFSQKQSVIPCNQFSFVSDTHFNLVNAMEEAGVDVSLVGQGWTGGEYCSLRICGGNDDTKLSVSVYG